MNTIRPRMEPYEELANAVILQAIKDYRQLWNFNRNSYAKKELIKFFYSQWYSILTRLDPEYLIEELEKEANAKRIKTNRKAKKIP